jgi:hypothetical protein
MDGRIAGAGMMQSYAPARSQVPPPSGGVGGGGGGGGAATRYAFERMGPGHAVVLTAAAVQ